MFQRKWNLALVLKELNMRNYNWNKCSNYDHCWGYHCLCKELLRAKTECWTLKKFLELLLLLQVFREFRISEIFDKIQA